MALADKLEQLPGRPGVYLFKGADGAVLYVGKARVLRDRVRSYFQASRPVELHKSRMVGEIADLDLVVTDSEMEALALENNLIKRHKPPYNVRLRDDKNHPYLKLTLAEEYPRLYVVRRPGEDANAYGGPYIPASLGRKTAGARPQALRHPLVQGDAERPAPAPVPAVPDQALHSALRRGDLLARALPARVRRRAALPRGPHRGGDAAPARADGGRRGGGALRGGGRPCATRSRPCERLEAPQKITTTDIEERDLFAAHVEGERAAVQVFSVRDGKVVAREGFLLDRLTEPEPVLASTLQQFYADGRYVPREIAGPGGDPGPGAAGGVARARGGGPRSASACRSAGRSCACSSSSCATRSWPSSWSGSTPASSRRRSCGRCATSLDLEVEPRRIECFDISNIQGSDIVASMVVFEDGLPKKSDYRKFRVKTVSGAPDDFASMREVVGRRYRRLLEEGKDLPDLVLIDGGKGQLGAAVEALDELGLGDQPVARLAKREELIFVPRARASPSPCRAPRRCCSSSSACGTRPIASRSASTGRCDRAARSHSELDDIPGVGPAKRRKLLSALRLGARRARRDRGRARDGGGEGDGRPPARAPRRGEAGRTRALPRLDGFHMVLCVASRARSGRRRRVPRTRLLPSRRAGLSNTGLACPSEVRRLSPRRFLAAAAARSVTADRFGEPAGRALSSCWRSFMTQSSILRRVVRRPFLWVLLAGLCLAGGAGVLAFVGPGQLPIVAEVHAPAFAEHVEDDMHFVGLVQGGQAAEAYEDAFEIGDEMFEARFNALDGVGANVGDGTRFTRVPRADLNGPGQWARHTPTRITGPERAGLRRLPPRALRRRSRFDPGKRPPGSPAQRRHEPVHPEEHSAPVRPRRRAEARRGDDGGALRDARPRP